MLGRKGKKLARAHRDLEFWRAQTRVFFKEHGIGRLTPLEEQVCQTKLAEVCKDLIFLDGLADGDRQKYFKQCDKLWKKDKDLLHHVYMIVDKTHI